MAAEGEIVALLEQRGPLTGTEIRDALGGDSFCQWKACMLSTRLPIRRVGRRFLRLDRNVEGLARLSPSILREFLTYSVVGLADDPTALDRRVEEIEAHVRAVTHGKLRLARDFVDEVADRLPRGAEPETAFCVLLAGDIVYEMAHDVPRPERSTGRMVRGSDIDLVFILDDLAPQAAIERLDTCIYERKYRYLINPAMREEIDYVVKTLGRLREQAAFDTFKRMVACKILQESVFVYGDQTLFDDAKTLLDEYGLTQELDALERSAVRARQMAEDYLLGTSQSPLARDDLYLFHTSDESEEFE